MLFFIIIIRMRENTQYVSELISTYPRVKYHRPPHNTTLHNVPMLVLYRGCNVLDISKTNSMLRPQQINFMDDGFATSILS